MKSHFVLQHLLLCIFSLCALASPLAKRADNSTDVPVGDMNRLFDHFLGRRLTELAPNYPNLWLRSVRVRPRLGRPTNGITTFMLIVFEFYDGTTHRFYDDWNEPLHPANWHGPVESNDQTWGYLRPWQWADKTRAPISLLGYLRSVRQPTKLQGIWLEKPIQSWSDTDQVWWMLIPSDGEKYYWLGDRDKVIHTGEDVGFDVTRNSSSLDITAPKTDTITELAEVDVVPSHKSYGG